MKITTHSYGGKLFRPTPAVFTDSNTGVILVCSSWSDNSKAQECVDLINESINSQKNPSEDTSNFEFFEEHSSCQKKIRTAVLHTNQIFYEKYNSEEWLAGVELFVGVIENGVLAFAQIGNPSPYLFRSGQWIHLGQQSENTLNFSSSFNLPPLPGQLLGANSTLDFKVSKLKIYKHDSLFLLSSSISFFDLPKKNELQNIAAHISRIHAENPFWVSKLVF